MSLQTKRALGRFILFALLGLLAEVFFTAAGTLIRGDWNMHGLSSPWMMFDYGLLGLVRALAGMLVYPLAARS